MNRAGTLLGLDILADVLGRAREVRVRSVVAVQAAG
jgi:hypothetical protein